MHAHVRGEGRGSGGGGVWRTNEWMGCFNVVHREPLVSQRPSLGFKPVDCPLPVFLNLIFFQTTFQQNAIRLIHF